MYTLFVGIVALYSTGHWIGATVLLLLLVEIIFQEARDPLGIGRYIQKLRTAIRRD